MSKQKRQPAPAHRRRVFFATTWRSYTAEGFVWLLTAGAMAVSYWSQVQVVIAHGFDGWESLVWGTSTDAGELIAFFLAREAARRGTPSWGAWLIAAACAAMSIQYNVMHSWGDWIGVESHAWMPLLALACWYWMLHGRSSKWTPAHLLPREHPVSNPEQLPPVSSEQLVPAHERRREQSRGATRATPNRTAARPSLVTVEQAIVSNPSLSDQAIANELGTVSRATVNRIRRGMQQEGAAA